MESSNRIGKKWEVEEEALLLKRVGEGVSHERIAAECKRTPGGIQSRLRVVACRMVDFGKTIDEASDATQLTPDQIIDALQKRDTPAPKPPVAKAQETTVTLLREIRDLLQTKRTSPPRRQMCSRCGRNTHTASSCFAKTHLQGHSLDDDSEEEIEWQCCECSRVYPSESAAEACRCQTRSRASGAGACYRCGRAGHYLPDCYASRHIKGYELD